MPDITMCNDKECPKSRSCFRFRAIADGKWQSYFTTSPRENHRDELCQYFWNMEEVDPLIKEIRIR
jgi:hypothetical protein